MIAHSLNPLRNSVPLNDPRRRFAEVRGEMVECFADFLDQGAYIGGAPVATFEKAFADWCGRGFAVAVGNGTDALELALRAAGVTSGDEVICVANAGGYSTAACVAIGAVPVYVDVRSGDAQIDFEATLIATCDRTKAIVATHLFGLRSDLSVLRRALDEKGRHDIRIIEDCAQAHGSKVVSGFHGDLATYSFYPTKNLGAMGDAGAVVVDEVRYAERVQALREYGWTSRYRSEVNYGRNSRMDGLQAAILTRSLNRVDGQNMRRREIWRRFTSLIPSGWHSIGKDDACFVAHLCVIVAPDRASHARMKVHLDEHGIGNAIHYPTLDPDQPAWKGTGRSSSQLTNAYWLLERILTIPCFPEMSDAEVELVSSALSTFKG
jgi:dTDP-4-amino-4,6-dideoxygalactose transaminase